MSIIVVGLSINTVVGDSSSMFVHESNATRKARGMKRERCKRNGACSANIATLFSSQRTFVSNFFVEPPNSESTFVTQCTYQMGSYFLPLSWNKVSSDDASEWPSWNKVSSDRCIRGFVVYLCRESWLVPTVRTASAGVKNEVECAGSVERGACGANTSRRTRAHLLVVWTDLQQKPTFFSLLRFPCRLAPAAFKLLRIP